jgi:hypothetical protein
MHFRSSPRRKTRATKPSRSRELEPQMKKRRTLTQSVAFFIARKCAHKLKRPDSTRIESGLLAFARPEKLVRASKGLIAL